jgi:hypothetical protein
VTRKRRTLGIWRLAGSSDCPLETSTEAEANTAQDRRRTRTDDCILCVRFSISSELTIGLLTPCVFIYPRKCEEIDISDIVAHTNGSS